MVYALAILINSVFGVILGIINCRFLKKEWVKKRFFQQFIGLH